MSKGKTSTIENKKARFDYFISDRYEAGIALNGAEVKSIRDGKASLKESYVRVKEDEAFVVSMYVSPYEMSSEKTYDSRRTRKLLLHKSEIVKLNTKMKEKGFSVIPLKLYFKRGKAKLQIVLAKGKRKYDKRQSLKKKTQQREVATAMGMKR